MMRLFYTYKDGQVLEESYRDDSNCRPFEQDSYAEMCYFLCGNQSIYTLQPDALFGFLFSSKLFETNKISDHCDLSDEQIEIIINHLSMAYIKLIVANKVSEDSVKQIASILYENKSNNKCLKILRELTINKVAGNVCKVDGHGDFNKKEIIPAEVSTLINEWETYAFFIELLNTEVSEEYDTSNQPSLT